jgi:DNA-binding protein HU-beta
MAHSKSDIVTHLKDKTGGTKAQAEAAVDHMLEFITDSLKSGQEVRVHGFGTFKVTKRAARTGRNPQTGATINIPETKSVSFKAVPSVNESL